MEAFKMNSILFGSALFILLPVAFGFNCYNCSSNDHIDCAEKFDHENSKIVATPCDDVFEARYCIKTTGIYEGEIGTKRFCSSRDYGDYCEYIKRLGDDRDYRSCVYTCSGDSCNGSSLSEPQLPIFLISAFLTILLTFRNGRFAT